MHGLNNHLVKKTSPACPLCRPCLLFYSYLCGTRNQFGLQQAGPWDSQVGKVARQELNTEWSSQPYIWIRSTGWALMASLWNLKHRHRPERSSWGKSEYQQPFRSACTCSLRVTAPFCSPSPHSQRQKGFSGVIYTLVLCIEWRALLTAFWNTIGFLLTAMCARRKYGLGEGTD